MCVELVIEVLSVFFFIVKMSDLNVHTIVVTENIFDSLNYFAQHEYERKFGLVVCIHLSSSLSLSVCPS